MGEKIDGIEKEPSFKEGSYFHSARTTLDVYNDLVDSVINKKTVLLDAGCGKKSLMARHNGKAAFAAGMDISKEAIRTNKAFRNRVAGDSYSLPFRDESFSLVVSQWMIEHIERPETVMREFHRVLRRGGDLIVATNSVYHPMMLLSAVLPTGLRDGLKRRIFPSYIEEDTFPTYYKFNSLSSMDRILTDAGFEKKFASYTGAPFFLFNKFLFKFSELYERVTDLGALRFMKMHVIVHYVKK